MTTRILRGDVRARLADLEDESVHAIVTSPPYWGLRSYLPAGHPDKHLEIGSEPTVEKWVAVMVDVFRQCRRVLRADGAMLVNLGDSYAGSRCGPDEMARDFGKSTLGGTRRNQRESSAARAMTSSRRRDNHEIPRSDIRMPSLKPKDLVGQPWMLAFALRADGWWLRQEIIWNKPNPMPESVTDRCTKSHEHLFLLSKSERYYWNFDAMQEEVNGGAHARLPGNVSRGKYEGSLDVDRDGEHRTKGGLAAHAERKRAAYKTPDGWDTRKGQGGHGSFHSEGREKGRRPDDDRRPKAWDFDMGSNRTIVDGYARTTPEVPRHDSTASRKARARAENKSMPDAMRNGIRPRKLAEAGGGTKNNESFDDAMAVMPDTRNPRSVWTIPTHPFKGAHFATFPPELARRCVTALCPPGGTVLDPFFGAGTVGLVADQLGMDAIGIELDDRSSDMAAERIGADAPLFAQVEAAA